MIAALWASVAGWAATVNANLCAEYQVDFSDHNGYGKIDDDYFTQATNRPARGAFLRITASDTPNSYTSHQLSDSNPACVTVPLDNQKTYTVKLVSKAEVSGKTILVKTSDGVAPEPAGGTANALFTHIGLGPGWTPVANPPTIVTGAHRAWTIAAVAAWALHRDDLGTPNATFTFYHEACTDKSVTPWVYGTWSCSNNQGHEIWMNPGDDSKITIAHELGHTLFALCDEDTSPEQDRTADMGVCDEEHGNGRTKEYTSYAAIEGIAWFFAAYVFNEPTGASNSCAFAKAADYNMDCDGSNDNTCTNPEDPDNEWDSTPSCGGCAAEAAQGTPDSDYLGTKCDGMVTDRSTRIDWWRTWWDLLKNTALTPSDVCGIWDGADPHNWDPNGGSGLDDPFERLHLSALQHGAGMDFLYYGGANGVSR